MDNAVALVRAYLHLNGYLAATEVPVVVGSGHKDVRVLTDLDVLAFRFPGGGRPAPESAGSDAMPAGPDPALGADPSRADMIVADVKEGRARLNASALDRRVIETALVSFGCCPPGAVGRHVGELVRNGATRLPSGHELRMIVFAGGPDEGDAGAARVITLGHVVRFLRAYLREHWSVIRHVESKDPAIGFLLTLEKAIRSLETADQPEYVER